MLAIRYGHQQGYTMDDITIVSKNKKRYKFMTILKSIWLDNGSSIFEELVNIACKFLAKWEMHDAKLFVSQYYN